MKERGIIFSSPMVRAILDSRKTQTRRIVKPQPETVKVSGKELPGYASPKHYRCPYGEIGDRLWVRETWAICEPYPTVLQDLRLPQVAPSTEGLLKYWKQRIMFRAGLPDDVKPADIVERGKADDSWRPSIHMPRWASRITLEITDVRVQRLQDISEEDAIAEGCEMEGTFPKEQPHPAGGWVGWNDAREWFAYLWDSIHGEGSWDANPWVWALTFKRVPAEQKEDE